MNTKQAEELTGITRQNIRYYERQGLLEPARETGNSYRDYSDEDIRRLKLIKMLRMLDMPLKDIEQVVKNEISLKEASARQQENLSSQVEQLKAALEVCVNIQKDKAEVIDVDVYLDRMEKMQRSGGMFARIVDDYKQVAQEERHRQFSFYTEEKVNTAGEFETVLKRYAKGKGKKIQIIETGMYPEFTLDGISYTAARAVNKNEDGRESAVKTQIICSKVSGGTGKNGEVKEISVRRRTVLQGIHTIRMNIRRHCRKSILNMAISMMILIVLSFYLGNLIKTKQQFEELPDKIPVRGTIMNANGELKNGLFIRQDILDVVYGSKYTEEIQETGELIGTDSAAENVEDESHEALRLGGLGEEEYYIYGISIPACIDGFTEGDIIWAEGWSWKKFLNGGNVCIADETFLKDRNLKAGDTLDTSLSYDTREALGIGLVREKLNVESFQIVGTGNFVQNAEIETPSVVIPIQSVKQIYAENDVAYWASSLSFKVKEPMKLNELKKELRDIHVQQAVPEAELDYAGSAALIDDEIFIQTATSINKNLQLLEGFLPFMLLVVVMAGYVVPHLLFQGRRNEYAIMRALGTSRMRCTVLFFIEHIALAFCGGFIGIILGICLDAVEISTAAAVLGLFLICYMAGAAAAMWAFGRISVAAVLARRD